VRTGFAGSGLALLRRLLPRWRTVEADVDEELDFHLAARMTELRAQGHGADEAARIARAEFGDVDAARRELAAIDRTAARKERAATGWREWVDDARFAVTHLRRHPGAAAAIAAILALGFGASVATFGILRETLIRPLPFREDDRLVHLFETQPALLGHRSEASWPDFVDWRADTRAFAGLEGYTGANVTVREETGATIRGAGFVTAGFFRLLGVEAVAGRTFAAGEDEPGAAPVVVLSYRYWRDRYGADRRALDSAVVVDQRPVRIVGVLPPDFRFAPVEPADFWLPIDASAARRAERFNHWVNVVARLAPGGSAVAASADLDRVMARLSDEYPSTNQGRTGVVIGLRTEFLGMVKPAVLLGFAAGTLLLLITIGNIASLLVARGLGRQRELLLRSALGAGRGRLVRQLAIECSVLAIAGGTLGLGVAGGLRLAIARMLPADLVSRLPALDRSGFDGAVLGFAGLGIAFAAVLFALFPVVRLTRGALVGPRSTTTRSGRRLRNAVVAGQLALVTVLMGGIGLVGRSVRRLLDEPLGFRVEGVVTARVALPTEGYRTEQARIRYFRTLLDRLGAVPGVDRSALGAVSNLPLRSGGTNTFRLEGAPEPPPTARPEATARVVADAYFSALGIPLVEGRVFTSRDDSAAAGVVIVNASLARRLGDGAPVLGRALRFYAFPDRGWTIVGVVGDVRTGKLDDPPPPTVYFAFSQAPESPLSIVARSTRTDLPAIIRREAIAVDPAAAVDDQGPLSHVVDASPALAIRRLLLATLVALGGVALALAASGLFAVVAGLVAERTREFGIRQALGAGPGRIRGLVLRQGLAVGLSGIGAGIVLFQAAARTLPSLFYRVAPTDPLTLGMVTGGLLLAVLGACWVPSRRATRADPALTLRSE
jgi:predicted permease